MSSRSHTIFIVYYNNITKKLTSKVSFCDLAGSEKYDIRENYEYNHLNELKYINKSLSVLGNVICALIKKDKEKKKNLENINNNLQNMNKKVKIKKNNNKRR